MRHTVCVSSLSGKRSIDVFPSKETHFFGFIQFPSLLAQLCILVAHPVGIGLPPILVVCNYHNDRGMTSLEQASSEGLLFMTRPQLVVHSESS